MKRAEILFDEPPQGVTLVFGGRLERRRFFEAEAVYYWTRPASPDEISAVVSFVGERSLPISTIVIGGLHGYPVEEYQLPQWFAELARLRGSGRIVVETIDLDPEARRRLIQGTRRACRLSLSSDPVAFAVDWVHLRLRGWMR